MIKLIIGAVAVLAIYFLICFYVAYNIWVWFKLTFSPRYKRAFITIMVFLSLNVLIERFFASKMLAYLGGMWLIIIGYGLLLLPIINLLYFIFQKKGIRLIGGVLIAFFAFIFIYGSYLAWTPVVRTYEVEVNKVSELDQLTVLLVSDLHLGKMVGRDHLEKLVDITEELDPDLILMPGDIIDDVMGPFLEHNMGEFFQKMDAPFGTYATTGNHEYYGGDIDLFIAEMTQAGVHVLEDEVLEIAESFYIVGRNDLTDEDRKSISELMREVDKEKLVIMLDHQPTALAEANEYGVDILLSGHTHRGQVFPVNWITSWLFENDYGLLKKDQFHSIVTSGYGFWGPPFRIGSQSEVAKITIYFNDL